MRSFWLRINNLYRFYFSYNSTNQITFYFGIFIIVTVVFGLLIIKPSLDGVVYKNQLLKDLGQKKTQLIENQTLLVQYSTDLAQFNSEITLLQQILPQSPKLDMYMVDLIAALSSNGYSLNRFNASTSETPTDNTGKFNSVITTSLTLDMQGNLVTFVDMLGAIESLKRITQIERVTITDALYSTSPSIQMNILVFSEKTK